MDRYARTRNFLDGDVSRLSPFLSHGMISPKRVLDHVLRDATLKQAEKFALELAWREYYQRVWQNKGEGILKDLRHPQEQVAPPLLPTIIREAQTGIHVIDHAITELKTTGCLHNHARMWLVALRKNANKNVATNRKYDIGRPDVGLVSAF